MKAKPAKSPRGAGEDPPAAPHDITAVCRLSGLTPAGLRMWEKRHRAVQPRRSKSGRRQYTAEDVERLRLLKKLADQGLPIHTTAPLTLPELQRRFGSDPQPAAPERAAGLSRETSRSMVVIGAHLSELLAATSESGRHARVVAEYPDVATAEAELQQTKADLLVVEIPALFADIAARLARLMERADASRAVVIYQYAQVRTIERLKLESGVTRVIRGPLSQSELRAVCDAEASLASPAIRELLARATRPPELAEATASRRYSDRQLAQISQFSPALECECPHHLASLLSSLNAFERYSSECAARNTTDAEVHASLQRSTARARATMEDALQLIVAFEGIDLQL